MVALHMDRKVTATGRNSVTDYNVATDRNSVFSASQPYTELADWALYNSFILDSGATTHICHDRSRFQNFYPQSDTLLAGSGPVSIEGWGDVDIQVQGDNGTSRTITLYKTAYIPTFSANVVSLNRSNATSILWDQVNSRLV